MHGILTARDSFLPYFFPSGPFTCIFSKTSSDFFPVLAVANTGSCVGSQNKIGHPAGCRFLCWVSMEYKLAKKTWLLARSGELQTQKLKSHLMRTQSLNILPLKPRVGQCLAIHATPTARDFFLPYFYPSCPFTCIFSKTSHDFSCVGCG